MAKFPKPDYKFWDSQNKLNELQAVCLWVEFEPSQEAFQTQKAIAIQWRFRDAFEQDILHIDQTLKAKSICIEWFFRNELKAYAERIGEMPAFLYPKTRTAQKATIPVNIGRTPAKPNTSTTKLKNKLLLKPTSFGEPRSQGTWVAAPVLIRRAPNDEIANPVIPASGAQKIAVETAPVTTHIPATMEQTALGAKVNAGMKPLKDDKRGSADQNAETFFPDTAVLGATSKLAEFAKDKQQAEHMEQQASDAREKVIPTRMPDLLEQSTQDANVKVPTSPITTSNLVYWRAVLYTNIKKIDANGKANVRGVINYLRNLGDKRILNKKDVDVLHWIDDVGDEQTVTKKTVSTATSKARKLP